MERLQWLASYNLGLTIIDLQHKKLISLVDKLFDILQLSPQEYKLQINKIVKALSDYVEQHFFEEELLMKTERYQGYSAHHEVHQCFIEKVNESLPYLLSGEKKYGEDFYYFLGRWLFGHILEVDKKFAEFVLNSSQKKGEK